MDEETKEMYLSYQAQLVAVGVVILALFITTWIIVQSMYILSHKEEDHRKRIQLIRRWAEIASLLYLLAVVYFLYRTWYDYQMNRTKANQWFLIATILAALAAYIRFFYVREVNGQVQAQDII